uniref:NAD(P)(+)--arginine ADP-ribosyltransferase n=1 Tax=Pelusios castaneus TaxID=367368 RepID=A0A8C8SDD7_9SAUR
MAGSSPNAQRSLLLIASSLSFLAPGREEGESPAPPDLGWGGMGNTLNNSGSDSLTCVGEGNSQLTLASSSVDDMYRGCEYAMIQQLPSLIQKELAGNKIFNLGWNTAKAWMAKQNMHIFPNTMKYFCSIAVVAYTLNNPPLYREFNTATRMGWNGHHAYSRYSFKAMHFLLTQAPKEIWGIKPSCATVYRGTNTNFSIRNLFRFGQFTSTSKSQTAAAKFGQKTFFVLDSCTGYALRRLSVFQGEKEVLVTPYEMFRVTEVKRNQNGKVVYAKSTGVCSNHNCAYIGKGEGRAAGGR